MKAAAIFQRAIAFLAIVSVCGCQSYEIRQTCIYSDDAGRVVSVDYCKAHEPHISSFVNPATGKEVDFESRLLVNVERDWDEPFTAWQSMNLNKMEGRSTSPITAVGCFTLWVTSVLFQSLEEMVNTIYLSEGCFVNLRKELMRVIASGER